MDGEKEGNRQSGWPPVPEDDSGRIGVRRGVILNEEFWSLAATYCDRRYKEGHYDRPSGCPSKEEWEARAHDDSAYFYDTPPPSPKISIKFYEELWLKEHHPELLWHAHCDSPLPRKDTLSDLVGVAFAIGFGVVFLIGFFILTINIFLRLLGIDWIMPSDPVGPRELIIVIVGLMIGLAFSLRFTSSQKKERQRMIADAWERTTQTLSSAS